jgi:hypothetical protein
LLDFGFMDEKPLVSPEKPLVLLGGAGDTSIFLLCDQKIKYRALFLW